MKNIKVSLIFAFILGIGLPVLNAQETTLATSGNASGSGKVSYSVGQVVFLTKSGADGTITEGVQQPYEILIPIGIDDENGITLECLLYPNPTDKYVKLKIEKHELNNLSCQLYNMNGLLLQNIKIASEETYIPMDDLAKATYLLNITENGKALKTFQIIKR